jgi:hypothetical protein
VKRGWEGKMIGRRLELNFKQIYYLLQEEYVDEWFACYAQNPLELYQVPSALSIEQ